MGAQNVGRDLEIDGARLAEVAEGAADAFVELSDHLVCDAQRARLPRDRAQDVHMGDVLQRAKIGLGARRAAANHQHGHASQRSVGDAVVVLVTPDRP